MVCPYTTYQYEKNWVSNCCREVEYRKKEKQTMEKLSQLQFDENQPIIDELRSALIKYLESSKVKSTEIPASRSLVNKLVNSLKIIMIEIDPMFAAMNPSLDLRGSADNKLKVFKPDEFDVDVVLSLPITESASGECVQVSWTVRNVMTNF